MRMSDNKSVPPSAFSERLNAVIERWVDVLPLHLRERFRDEFGHFGDAHDRTMSTLEGIWKRRDRRLSLDEATGLARRRPFQDHLALMLAAPDPRPFTAVGVLFIDVDNLKQINDTYGHRVGDKALAVVGRGVRDAIRFERSTDYSDRAAPEDDYSVSRHGGDEFLVALELEHKSSIGAVASRIKRRVEDPVLQRSRGFEAPPQITISMGGVVYELPDVPARLAPNVLARELIAAADEQMYLAKRDRRIHIAPARFTDHIEIDRDHAEALDAS
jgi:diguanylate cyclase (GGDEF)-like protein